MSAVTAAAIAAIVMATTTTTAGVNSGNGEGGEEGGGGGGGGSGDGGGGGRGGGGYHVAGMSNVTEEVVAVVTGLIHTVTPASLRQPNNSRILLPGVIGDSLAFSSSSSASSSFLTLSPPPHGNDSSINSTISSISTLPQRPESPYELWAQVVIAVILGALIVCTIIGNCLVCISVAIVRRLQTPSNLLIVSLAVADLLVAILVMPLTATLQIYGGWVLGPSVCDMWTTTDVLLCTASILNLCMISVDRYLVITRPFQYAMRRTPKRMALMITIVWALSAVISVPPIFGLKSPHQAYDCYISLDIGYQIYATLCAFYLPLIVMIFVYFKIWLVSSKIAKAEARSKVGSFDRGDHLQVGRPTPRDSNASQYLPNGTLLGVKSQFNGGGNGDEAAMEILPKTSENSERLKRRRFTIRSLIPRPARVSSSKERKATKTLGIIMGCFTLCWLPFFILALVKTFCGDACHVPPWLDSILLWLGYANSFLNPVIYARFNRDFRTPFKEILLFRCRGINSRMRSESYVEQYGGADPRNSLRPPMDCIVRYNSQGQTVVHIGNGSANSQSETKI